MGFLMQPWLWIALIVMVLMYFDPRHRRKDYSKVKEVEQATISDSRARNLKIEYRCRSCPQRFEPPNLFLICPVCQSPVDKFENGVAVDERNPAFPDGTLPFIRRDSNDADTGKKPGKAVQKPKLVAPNENVVALNLKAVDNLHRSCWLVVAAESGELAQNIAEHSANFRVLYRKPPKRLSNNRWLVWGKARSAA